MNFKFNLSDWLWVGYPIVVVVFMILGINFMLTSGQSSLSKLTVRQDEIEAENMRADNLKTKLASLRLVDVKKSRAELAAMLEAVPPARQFWLLIGELNQAAAESGMGLTGYKGTVGDIREATESAVSATEAAELAVTNEMILKAEFDSSGVDKLARGMATLERLMPLVKVVKIEYSLQKADVTVEGAWSAWPAARNDPELPLPKYQAQVSKVLTQLQKFEPVGMEIASPAAEASPAATF